MKLSWFPVAVALLLLGCSDGPTGGTDMDAEVGTALAQAGVTPLPQLPKHDPNLVRLGQALMFDKILSGNRDVSCATCHNPAAATTDGLSMSIGTGGQGAAAARVLSHAPQFTPRNSQELFNRGYPEFESMFWDGRVSGHGGAIETPAGSQLPAGVANALAAQAMFPVTTRLEMRGRTGDVDRFGNPNELAAFADNDQVGVWAALMDRLRAIPEYVQLFQAAYPTIPVSQLGFQHAANAIAAFEADAFTSLGSPLDRYLGGDVTALSEAEKRGALLFFGKANCGSCHLGPHLSDNLFHSIGVPQIGPGADGDSPQDHGRERVTGSISNRFQFRTPPLRNVELTGPWMHDGAYTTTLDAAVRHYLNTRAALRSYDATQLREDLRNSYLSDPASLDAMSATIDVLVTDPLALSDQEVADIVAFLRALTDPAARDLSGVIPASVPSGLPVGD